jgi:hypothetical protein
MVRRHALAHCAEYEGVVSLNLLFRHRNSAWHKLEGSRSRPKHLEPKASRIIWRVSPFRLQRQQPLVTNAILAAVSPRCCGELDDYARHNIRLHVTPLIEPVLGRVPASSRFRDKADS